MRVHPPRLSRQLIYEEVTSNTVEKQLLGMQYILELLPLEIDDRASMVTNFGARTATPLPRAALQWRCPPRLCHWR